MNKIMKHISFSGYSARKLFGANQKGVTMIEYALLAALISVVAIAAIGGLGNKLNVIWGNISTAI